MYTLNHTVYRFPINSTLTVGRGHHDLGVLPDKTVVRLYNYPFKLFPAEIHRDAYDNITFPFDKFLVYEVEREGENE